jgi:hypothetical protein
MKHTKKIRPLKYADFKRVKAILAKYVEQSGDDAVKGIISAARASSSGDVSDEQRSTQIVAVFMDVFKKLITHLDKEVHGWFCDLVGVTAKDYDELPFDIDMQIIDQLRTAPEVANFFTGVSQLSSIAGWLQDRYEKLKGKYDTAIDSLKKDLKN